MKKTVSVIATFTFLVLGASAANARGFDEAPHIVITCEQRLAGSEEAVEDLSREVARLQCLLDCGKQTDAWEKFACMQKCKIAAEKARMMDDLEK